jgi:hypothetical protein
VLIESFGVPPEKRTSAAILRASERTVFVRIWKLYARARKEMAARKPKKA